MNVSFGFGGAMLGKDNRATGINRRYYNVLLTITNWLVFHIGYYRDGDLKLACR